MSFSRENFRGALVALCLQHLTMPLNEACIKIHGKTFVVH